MKGFEGSKVLVWDLRSETEGSGRRGKRIETERRKLKNVVLAKIEEGKIKFI